MSWEFDEDSGSYTWVSDEENPYVDSPSVRGVVEEGNKLADDTAAWEGMGSWSPITAGDTGSQWKELTAKEDTDLYGVRVFKDTTDPTNPKYLQITPGNEYILNGEKIWSPSATGKNDWSSLISKLGNFATSPAGAAILAGTAYGMGIGNKPQTGGYKGSIPSLAAIREQVKMPEYKPYSGQAVMGGKFFTDTQYVPTTNEEALATARTAAQAAAEKYAASNPKAPAAATAPETYLKPKKDMSGLREIYRMPEAPRMTPSGIAAGDIGPSPQIGSRIGRGNVANPGEDLYFLSGVPTKGIPSADDAKRMTEDLKFLDSATPAASGGLMDLGRYLSGPTDGMADKIPSSIDDEQPAKLSHGEFVIPADVVSHLGNGNSDAGAEQLYKMMDRIRKDRTGTSKQGKQINPENYYPGGIAGYADGGAVAFTNGGSTDTALSRAASGNLLGATQETNLAPWVGDYVANMLGRTQGIANQGYQAYTGPLSAGTSPLQQQAFNAAGQLNPAATFDTAAAQQYMNPFIDLALKPQLDEMRRQAEISRINTAGRLAQAGAYGGGRQAIMESELLRNLGQQQALTTGKAYETAFDKAMNQYNVGRQQQIADIGALAGLGQQERQIEQQGIDQLRGEFEKQRQFPYEQLKFQQSMLQGLPIGSTSITPNTSPLSQLGLTTKQVGMLSDWLNENVFKTPTG